MTEVGSEEWLVEQRKCMVERDLSSRGVVDEAVLAAMGMVPRERFLPDEMSEFAYENHPLPIAEGQTISRPHIVAVMAEALRRRPRL